MMEIIVLQAVHNALTANPRVRRAHGKARAIVHVETPKPISKRAKRRARGKGRVGA